MDTNEALHKEVNLMRNLIKSSSMLVYTWSLDGSILSINPYGERATGYKEDELIGKSWIDLFLDDKEKDKVNGLIEYLKSGKTLKNSIGNVWKSKYGNNIELIWTDSPITDENGKVVKIISVGEDITNQRNLIRRLNNLAYYDSLTGLPNKLMLKNEADKIINEAKEKNKKLAILYIDMDNFNQINNTFGHDAGDKLLIHISKLLKEESTGFELLSKLNEDEFCVIFNDFDNQIDIDRKTIRVLDIISKPYYIDNYEYQISASIGISIFPRDGDNFNDLFKRANMAMYQMKKTGKNGYLYYKEELGEKIAFNTFILNQIKRGLNERHFKLQFQPLIDLKTNKVYGLESLLRWHHPEKGYISPLDYISLAEESGQIIEITSYILRMALNQKRIWKDKGINGFKIGINLSSKSLMRCGIDKEVNDLLKEFNIAPDEFALEITETAFMDNMDNCSGALFNLEKVGVSIALDDFGTGYSSLAKLKSLPITYLKIDMDFIRPMKKGNDEEAVVRTIIDMAHQLGLKVVAEGIETEEQLMLLKEMGCDFGQGYYLAKPMDPIDFEKKYFNN